MLKPNILLISDLFPTRAKPAFGIFVERQAYYLRGQCNITCVVPLRIFPPLSVFNAVRHPRHLLQNLGQWRNEIVQVPPTDRINDLPVYYPKYTSFPRQGFHATWGFFAYPFVYATLKKLHQQNSFKLIHAHYATPAGIIALLAKKWMKIPVVLSIHGSDVTYSAPQNALGAKIIRWVFRNADCLLTNSLWTKKKIMQYEGAEEKIHIIRLGGNQETPPPFIPQPVTQETPAPSIKLLSVGYLEARKGHVYVLQAIKTLRAQGIDVRYVIVGNGSQQHFLENLVRELEIEDAVSFEGYKPHTEVWAYFSACDIFVLPSWNEAFGVVYLEALSYGKPIIGCEGEGGPEDLHALGDCIELVKPRDTASLVEALKRLIHNPTRRLEMGELGRQIVQAHFTWEKNAAETFTIYQQLIQCGGND